MYLVILTKGQTNTVVVTLSEKTTIEPVTYLFRFENKQTCESAYCLVSELSQNVDRYNEFQITETSTPDPEDGEVTLTIGDYIYYSYELTPSQAASIDFDNVDVSAYNLVEEMKMRCIDDSLQNTEYSPGKTNTVYEG